MIEAVFPEFVQATAAVEATEGEEVTGAGFGPEPPGLLAPSAADGLASGLNHAGADEVTGRAEGSLLHSIHLADPVA